MTIEIFGHVQAIENGGGSIGVTLCVHVEAWRMYADHKPVILRVFASKAETEVYRPGMGVKIQIQPHQFTAKTEGGK
jgi:hypothetical protein